MMDQKRYVLVLGGSTFMGKSFLSLLNQDQSYEIHYINRGKVYWDNEITQIQNIHYTYGNRDETQDYVKVLKYLSGKLSLGPDRKWDVVIDFCAFYAKNVKGVYDALTNMVNLYILISTDSIYDVCDRKIRNQSLIEEHMDVRPNDDSLYEQYKEEEDYGHDKLKCEEFLKYNAKNEFPWVALRLPDVIGPYDDTGRFWAYIKWIQSEHPLETDSFTQSQQLSFVYSLDVCQVLLAVMKEKEAFLFESFNVCASETISLKGFLDHMVKEMKVDKPWTTCTQRARKFYPSVECGPISGKKLNLKLKFKMTPLKQAISETVKFFLGIKPNQFRQENEKAMKKFQKKFTNKRE